MTNVTVQLRCRNVGPDSTCEIDDLRSLVDLAVGETAMLAGVCGLADDDSARRLYDLGFAPGAPVTPVRTSPLGGPRVYRVADYEVALRASEARCLRLL